MESKFEIFNILRRSHYKKFCLSTANLASCLRLAAVLFTSSLTAFVTSTFATGSIFVDGSNPACTDSGSGSEALPYCTISAAADQQGAPGVTIVVKPGVYREQVNVPVSGTPGNPLIFEAQGAPVVIDGADDYSSSLNWTLYSGNVWLATAVTWEPKQVFVDGARLTPSTNSPNTLPVDTFRYIPSEGLYVNIGGDNPGAHDAVIGRRAHGFRLAGDSWITIDGFMITRTEDKGIYVKDSSDNVVIANNIVDYANRYGIAVRVSSDVIIRNNLVSNNNDHGIALSTGATNMIVENNESFLNARPNVRAANGIFLFNASNNLIQNNLFYDNQDSGEQINGSGSVDNISIQNISWRNGDHGFDHVGSIGTIHIGDVAWGNYKEGFSVEASAINTQISNSIAIDNGLSTGSYNLFVDSTSVPGFVSDFNIFWNSTTQEPIKYISTKYATLSEFSSATGHDINSIQADPQFIDPVVGDFHLQGGSPAIDSADTSLPDWPDLDAEGNPRQDDSTTSNTGSGPIDYADRGALEFVPNGIPVAMLTVTPSSGQAPLLVTADASASIDPNGVIVSYLFDFGDGTMVGPQATPTATHTYGQGIFTLTVTVTDNDSLTDTDSQVIHISAPASSNIVGNPSFETDTSGWKTYGGATMQRIVEGQDGMYSLEVTGPSASTGKFGINDSPNWVDATPASGTVYRFSVWVKSESDNGSAFIRIREYLNGVKVGTTHESLDVGLSPSWQNITLDYTSQAAGSTLDFQVLNDPVTTGEIFMVDNISIQIIP